jgi:phosphoglycolate phosphatase-like HAD superfamily hydrolase
VTVDAAVFDIDGVLVDVSGGIGSVAELQEAGAVAIADTPAELLALPAGGERYT